MARAGATRQHLASLSSRRAQIPTVAPACAKATASPAPMPDDAPVTSTRLPQARNPRPLLVPGGGIIGSGTVTPSERGPMPTIERFAAGADPDLVHAALVRDGVVILEELLSASVVARVNEEVEAAVAAADPDEEVFNPVMKAFHGPHTKQVAGAAQPPVWCAARGTPSSPGGTPPRVRIGGGDGGLDLLVDPCDNRRARGAPRGSRRRPRTRATWTRIRIST